MRGVLKIISVAALAAACSANDGTPRSDDSQPSDGEGADTGSTDTGGTDTGGTDAGGTDTGGTDTGGTDTGGTDTGGTDTGGTDTGGDKPSVPYPTGDSGTTQGKIVSKYLSWEGYGEGGGDAGRIVSKDYFDPDGSKGIHAVLITTGAVWCPNCRTEAAELDEYQADPSKWQGMGIKILQLVIEDGAGAPATMSTVDQWRTTYGAEHFAVAMDPRFSFAKVGDNGLPLQLVVNPRNMEIVYRQEGYSPDYPALENLARSNQP